MLVFESSYFNILTILYLAISFALFVVFYRIIFHKIKLSGYNRNMVAVIVFILGIIFLLLTKPIDYFRIQNIFERKEYLITLGSISDFAEKRCKSHNYESFTVNNNVFTYTNQDITSLYFNIPKCKKGPIQRIGQKVKVYYIKDDNYNKIVKMWVF